LTARRTSARSAAEPPRENAGELRGFRLVRTPLPTSDPLAFDRPLTELREEIEARFPTRSVTCASNQHLLFEQEKTSAQGVGLREVARGKSVVSTKQWCKPVPVWLGFWRGAVRRDERTPRLRPKSGGFHTDHYILIQKLKRKAIR
jgi:hypothetical protein